MEPGFWVRTPTRLTRVPSAMLPPRGEAKSLKPGEIAPLINRDDASWYIAEESPSLRSRYPDVVFFREVLANSAKLLPLTNGKVHYLLVQPRTEGHEFIVRFTSALSFGGDELNLWMNAEYGRELSHAIESWMTLRLVSSDYLQRLEAVQKKQA